MDAATVPCELCGASFARAAATYSTSGQLVCPACSAKTIIAGGADRAAASARSTRIGIIVSAALVVAVPSLMIAAGVGQYVSIGLIVLGGVLVVGGRAASRAADAGVRRGALFVALAGVAAIFLGIALRNVLGRR
jgi:hypothetical protein